MMTMEAATATDPGRERGDNQDRVWAQVYQPSEGEPVGLFIVCDGIGGHLGGECASHWAVEAVKREMEDIFAPKDPRGTVALPKEELETSSEKVVVTRVSGIRKIEKLVRQAVQRANQVVYEYAQQKPDEAGNAGTTITLALVVGNRGVIGNVGDSRTYLIRNNNLQQITKDHSLVATMVANHQISPSEIYTHPQRNLIYRSLGLKSEVDADTFIQIFKPGDQLLLCSDGLWEMVPDDQVMVQLVMKAATPQEACRQLVEAANQAGGKDNIGVVVVRIS
jgi:serine/threonine protein phosphatase PrpC